EYFQLWFRSLWNDLSNATEFAQFRVRMSELIFGSFCPILKEKELGFKRRRREEGEEEEKKEEINKIGQDHCGFSSGVIPIKVCESLVWVYPFPPHTKLVFMI
ncbi:hypothetical protein MTR67_016981, partial [Solanum verrucosum]